MSSGIASEGLYYLTLASACFAGIRVRNVLLPAILCPAKLTLVALLHAWWMFLGLASLSVLGSANKKWRLGVKAVPPLKLDEQDVASEAHWSWMVSMAIDLWSSLTNYNYD